MPQRRYRSAVVVIVAALMLAVFAPAADAGPVNPLVACGPEHNPSLQAGYSTNHWSGPQPTLYEGVSAHIHDKGGYATCSMPSAPGGNFVTSWNMIFGQHGYAQSGNFYWPDGGVKWGTCVKRWAEQVSPTGQRYDREIGGCTLPGINRFWQQSVFTGGDWHMRSNIDTTIIIQSSWNQFDWLGPFQVAFDSESYYAENNIPGTAASPQDQTNMQIQKKSDDQWYTTSTNVYLGVVNDNSSRWGTAAPCCAHTQTWTK